MNIEAQLEDLFETTQRDAYRDIKRKVIAVLQGRQMSVTIYLSESRQHTFDASEIVSELINPTEGEDALIWGFALDGDEHATMQANRLASNLLRDALETHAEVVAHFVVSQRRQEMGKSRLVAIG